MPLILNLALLPSPGKKSSRKVNPSLPDSPLGSLASGPGAADAIDIAEAVVLGVFNRALFNMFYGFHCCLPSSFICGHHR